MSAEWVPDDAGRCARRSHLALGVEPDKYVEAVFDSKINHASGAYSKYRLMIADGVLTNNDWTADDSNLNVRQVYAELGNLQSFADSSILRTRYCGPVNGLIAITSIFTSSIRTLSFSWYWRWHLRC